MKSNLLGLGTVCLMVVGCAAPRLPDYHADIPPVTARTVSAGGVEVTIDPFVEKERSQKYFGINAINEGIGIVHVRVTNRSTDQTFLVEKKNFRLLRSGDADRSAVGQKVDTGTAGAEATALVAAGLGSVPMLFAAASLLSEQTEVRRNFVSKEMADATVSPGKRLEGFLFFQGIDRKAKNWAQNSAMLIELIETKSRETVKLNTELK